VSARILAIDTTGDIGSLALVEDGAVVEETRLHAPEGFAQILFASIERLLEARGWRREEIDCFATAAGPGAFTGVRVGMAAAKGLAEALGKRAVAVSNLAAVASFGGAARRAAFVDARRGEIYGAIYDAELRLIGPEVVAKFPQWRASLPPGEIEFVTTNLAPFRDALAGTRVVEAPRVLAGAIGRIAAARLAGELALDAAALDANYVRRSDAELFWREEA
jgi:tRNA threonylcarbamoyladenosine biosynthesis protein TsaB